MKRSKDINIYEIRLEGKKPWNLDVIPFIDNDDNLLKYDYVRIIIPEYAFRLFIPFIQFYNFINDGVSSTISIDNVIQSDGKISSNAYLEITAISNNVATLTCEDI